MELELDNRTFICTLVDDGTLDVTVSVYDVKTGRHAEGRFDNEGVARVPSGFIPTNELVRLFEDVIDQNWEELTGEKNA